MGDLTYKLEVFEGPLDLLLSLINKNKVSIHDIPIALILRQYLEYIDAMNSFNLEVTSEFIVMASHLVFIKSKMLLPRQDEEAGEDPRSVLVETLLEYQRFKEVSGFFQKRGEIGRNTFVKPPEQIEKDRSVQPHDSDNLLTAIRSILNRNQRRMPPPVSLFTGIVGHETVPVEMMVESIMARIAIKPCRLEELFAETGGRSEIVAVFLALLELCKDGRVDVTEEGQVRKISQAI